MHLYYFFNLNLFSVPFKSLSIFDLCLYITNPPTNKERTKRGNLSTPSFIGKKQANIGSNSAPIIEPKEIYFVNFTITIKARNTVMIPTAGAIDENIPF